jgi:hypothetical protein
MKRNTCKHIFLSPEPGYFLSNSVLSELEVAEVTFQNVLEFKKWLNKKVPKVKQCKNCKTLVMEKPKRREVKV